MEETEDQFYPVVNLLRKIWFEIGSVSHRRLSENNREQENAPSDLYLGDILGAYDKPLRCT